MDDYGEVTDPQEQVPPALAPPPPPPPPPPPAPVSAPRRPLPPPPPPASPSSARPAVAGSGTPLHPPEQVSAPGPANTPARERPPSRPPIYDPAHYGYGPWRPTDEGRDAAPTEVQAQPTGWLRYRGPVALGLLAAVAVSGVLWLGAVLFGGAGTNTVETIFDFGDSVPSVTLDGEVLDIQALLNKVQPSVVTINTDAESLRGIFEGSGSGIVVSEDGLVLTNFHVIQGADTIEITFFDGTVKAATLVGGFPDNDIAIVQAQNVSGLIPADLGTVETLRVGDDVVAIGNALDLGSTPSVTKGIVSAKGRTIEAETVVLEGLIQTDAAINPGNSGGPLVNAAGQVVGINTAIIDNAQNIGFAISIDTAAPLIERALNGDAELNPDTAFLGVTAISVASLGDAVLEQFAVTSSEGAFVQETLDGSPATRAGILRGDVIVSIDGQAIATAADVARTVRSMRPGDSVEVVLERSGQTKRLQIVLEVRN